MNRGKRAITIDEVNLDWCFQPGVKLDFRHFLRWLRVTAKDVEAELERIRHSLRPLEIVLINTRAGSRYGQADYVTSGCGMGYEATMYLLERGVRITGTMHGAGIRHLFLPPGVMRKRMIQYHLGRPQGGAPQGLLPPGEAASPGGAAGSWIIVACFPVKIRAGSAG